MQWALQRFYFALYLVLNLLESECNVSKYAVPILLSICNHSAPRKMNRGSFKIAQNQVLCFRYGIPALPVVLWCFILETVGYTWFNIHIWLRSGLLNPQPAGKIWPMEPCDLAHRALQGSGNLVREGSSSNLCCHCSRTTKFSSPVGQMTWPCT